MELCSSDFNGDGNADVIINGNTTGVMMLFGNGDGTFIGGNAITADGHSRGMDAADFNHDGLLDFARAQYGNGYVYVYLGDGTGAFTRSYIADAEDDPYGLAAGDFDGDGHPDIIVNSGAAGRGYFIKGNGDGTFHAATRLASIDTGNHGGFDACDWDRDGDLDLIHVNYNGRAMWYYPGDGEGSFGAPVQVSTFGSSYDLMAVAAPPATSGAGSPQAVASASTLTAAVGADIVFDGTASADADGTIALYQWSFGDGTSVEGDMVTHAYATEGRKRVLLSITDNSGRKAHAAITVNVQGDAPSADAGGPYTFGESSLNGGAWHGAFSGSGSDAESAIAYSWDFGDSFADDFEDGDTSGWSNESGTWVEADGAYTETDGAYALHTSLMKSGGRIENFTASVDATMVSGFPEARLLFRSIDGNNGYHFILSGGSSNGVYMYRYIGGSATDLTSRKVPFVIRNGETYNLKVVCRGPMIEGYINDVLLLSVHENYFTSGYAGVGNWYTVASYDNFKVTSMPATGPTPSHTYFEGPGSYTAALTVTDAGGKTATDTAQVNLVYNDPPVAEAGGPYQSTEQQAWAGYWPVQLDGSASTDDVEIVSYQWAIQQDDFAGTEIADWWDASNATQDNGMTITGPNFWGGHYLFSNKPVVRSFSSDLVFECRMKAAGSHAMLGFKNTSANYSYPNLPYAIYLIADHRIHIYEDGADRGHTGFYWTDNVLYDIRIALGADGYTRYFFRVAGQPQWSLLPLRLDFAIVVFGHHNLRCRRVIERPATRNRRKTPATKKPVRMGAIRDGSGKHIRFALRPSAGRSSPLRTQQGGRGKSKAEKRRELHHLLKHHRVNGNQTPDPQGQV